MKHLQIALLIVGAWTASARADQAPNAPSSTLRPYYVGTSAFLVMNMVHDDKSPHFFQMDLGRQFTSKDRVAVQAISWRYYHPLGIPWQDSPESPANAFPGHVRAVGVGLEYQRTLMKGFYSSISAIPLFTRYYDTRNEKIANGLQMYLTGRFGYHFGVGDRLFFEPSVDVNYWPVSTNTPAGFEAQNDKWPSYFLFMPDVKVGFRF